MSSLAVLSFEVEAGETELRYVGDGIAEGVIVDLTPVRDLRVMARSTVFRYRDRGLDPRQAGGELKVDAVLTGRLLRRGANLVVDAELVRVADGSRLWGRRYDAPSADLARTQADISERLSDSLRLRLTSDQRRRLGRPETARPRAYELYLRGRYALDQRTLEGVQAGPAPPPAGRGRGPRLRPRLRRHRRGVLHPGPRGPGASSRATRRTSGSARRSSARSSSTRRSPRPGPRSAS